jgi:hypothetical protein
MRGQSDKTIRLSVAAKEILAEIQPASVRAVCYRLFVNGHIANMSKNETNKVSKALVKGRESGFIPWEWIVDEARAEERVPQWNEPEEIISAAVRGYRKDYWQEQPYHVEVWSEKGTIRGTLKPILDEYGVAFRAMHGYSSATVLQNIAELSRSLDKPFIALYVGDYDPSGMNMSEQDLPTRLQKYGGRIELIRIALIKKDVEQGDLPFFEAITKAKDSRHDWFVRNYGNKCWELDAMSPLDLRARVEFAIKAYVDADKWEHAKHIEAVEIESLRDYSESWIKTRQASICSERTQK